VDADGKPYDEVRTLDGQDFALVPELDAPVPFKVHYYYNVCVCTQRERLKKERERRGRQRNDGTLFES
jgi:hypothetical protein